MVVLLKASCDYLIQGYGGIYPKIIGAPIVAKSSDIFDTSCRKPSR
jgi:hypothetical protein